MRIIIAPNAFKGSLSAKKAAHFIEKGLRRSHLSGCYTLFPVGDGGDGTAELISEMLGYEKVSVLVKGPVGKQLEASFGWHEPSKKAVLELSAASGIGLINEADLNPLKANTAGTGELIKAALDKGAREIILGIGGSASVDGGTALLAELGVRFLDQKNNEINDLPSGLIHLHSVDTKTLDIRLKACKLIVLCDVENTLLGNNGAAKVFGPQKGAGPEEVKFLEYCLERFNRVVAKTFNTDMSVIRYGGAAGGVASSLSAFAQAELVSGIDYFMNLFHFDEILDKADVVITAEGSLDVQTLQGKGAAGIAIKAGYKGVPCIMLAGAVPLCIDKDLQQHFSAIFTIGHGVVALDEAIRNTAADLERTACQIGNILALTKN